VTERDRSTPDPGIYGSVARRNPRGTPRRAASILVLACLAGSAPARAQVSEVPDRRTGPAPSLATPPTARFAIVIGNNLSAIPQRGALQFADDDALATHDLLTGAGVHSVLLARLDETSQKLHPGAVTDGLPRWADLAATFDRLVADMRRERTAGHAVELFLFYSGHGDVEHGEGYVLLEDRHLTRTLLAGLLERSPATHNHVVIDACKSYFLAFEKGPGGRRTRFSGGFAVPAELSPERLANTGFVLSTSSDRDSHEWERFGGGVFSHEVRSALLGAADVDRDGRISYAELGAFLTTAGQAVTNPRFRPDFLIRPPGGKPRDLAETLLRWDAPPRSAVILDQAVGHVYIETATGERVLDVHAASQQQLVLRVPARRPLFVRGDDTGGGERVLDADEPTPVSALVARPSSIARRGAALLAFEELFAVPFGEASVRDYGARWTSDPPRAPEENPDDATPRSPRATVRTISGATAIASGALAVAASGLLLEQFTTGQSASQADRVGINRTLRRLAIGSSALGAVAIASGAVWFALRDRDAPHPDEIAVSLRVTAVDAAPSIGVTLGRAW
jgi:hypothetical protein